MYISAKSIQNPGKQDAQEAAAEEAPEHNSDANSLSHYLNSFPNLTQSQIPQSMIPGVRKTFKCDIYHRKSPEELKFVRDYYFIKFMEGLNKLNRVDERRVFSKSAIAYLESNYAQNSSDTCIATSIITNTIGQNIASTNPAPSANPISSSSTRPQFSTMNQLLTMPTVKPQSPLNLTSPKKWLYPQVAKYMESGVQAQSYNDQLKLEIFQYLENEYKVHMLNLTYGVPFIQNKTDIPLNCFISAEATWWCIEHVNEVDNEADAICLMQIMCDFDLIRHISNQQKIYIHGFYLYYIITDETRSHHLYTKGKILL